MSGGFFVGDGSGLTNTPLAPGGIAFVASNNLFTGQNTFTDTVTTATIMPGGTNWQFDLGASTNLWDNLYVNRLNMSDQGSGQVREVLQITNENVQILYGDFGTNYRFRLIETPAGTARVDFDGANAEDINTLTVFGGANFHNTVDLQGSNTIQDGFFVGDGSGLTNLSIGASETDPLHTNWLATNTYVQAETDPVWTSASNLYYLQTQADALFATGTPLYVFTETDPLHTNWLATNTYVQTETDPVWTSASNLYYLQTEADSIFATGTPLYVETDPLFTNWLGTNTYVQTETDPVFTNWLATNALIDHAYGGMHFRGTNLYPALTGTFAPVTNLIFGSALNVTANPTNGTFVPLIDGAYKVDVAFSFAGAANDIVEMQVRLNGVANEAIAFQRTLGSGGDRGSASATCILSLTNGTIIDASVRAMDGSGAFTLHAGAVAIHRVGP